MTRLDLPFFTDYRWIVGIFVLSLLIFHWALVLKWPIDRVGWKNVDYIWISLALVGLLAAISESRQIMARSEKNSADSLLVGALERVHRDIDAFTGSNTSCDGRFVYNEQESPPREIFDKIQREHEESCLWFRMLKGVFPRSVAEVKSEIDLTKFTPRPKVSDRDLTKNFSSLQQSVDGFNYLYRARASLEQQSRKNEFEITLVVIWPFFLVLGVALRLTKITGEIRIDRQSKAATDDSALSR